MPKILECILVIVISEIMIAEPMLGQIVSIDPDVPKEGIEKDLFQKSHIYPCWNEEIVSLPGLRLKELPSAFVKSDTIRSIVMHDNELTNIPRDMFDESPNLECLDLARNRIPFDAFQVVHAKLKTLILDNQSLSEWYDWSSGNCLQSNTLEVRFPSLENLSWKGINYDCLYVSLVAFPALRNIDLSDSNIQYLETNTSVTNYTPHLKTVHLERNRIEKLSFEYLGNIEELYLDGNPLRELWIDPTNTNLKQLSLSGCSFERPVPLETPSLVILDLSDNKIRETGNTMFQHTPLLEILNLSNNKLYMFPALNHLYNLRKLSLGHNSIDRITHIIMLKSLKTLNLRSNRISVIDKMAFSQLDVLEELDLSGNELEALPFKWHEGMRMLRYLNLKSNKFSTIDGMSVTYCSSLTELHINGNYIKQIDINALKRIPDRCVLYVI